MDVASPYNRLLPAEDIMRLQLLHNNALAETHEASRMKNLSVRRAIQEGSDALRWLLEDAMHLPPGESLLASLTEGTRMRGLGILIVAFAVVCLAVDALVD